MSKKHKKKRNKAYQGSGAAKTRPSVTRIEAVNRGRLRQWWFEKKPIIKPVALIGGVVIFIVWLVSELLRLL